MKVILIVAETADVDHLSNELVGAGYPVTKLGSSGGLLRRGNSTLISGVPDDAVDGVIEIVRRLTHARTELVPVRELPLLGQLDLTREPLEVRRGGAVIWVLPVDRYERC